MARKTEQTALATVEESRSLMTVDQAALADAFDFSFDVDGLEEVDSEDLRFAVKVWNMRSKKPDSDDFFRIDEFFDTLTEQTTRELNCVFVTLHKTNDYSYFDNDKNETVRVCSSYDREVGKLRVMHPESGQAEGTERNCDGCPDSAWRKDAKGKNVRNCAPVYGVIGIELDPVGGFGAPFMIRFKKTSLRPFKEHMQKHHIARMKDANGKAANVPLYAFGVKIKLQADPGGKFAVPVIERGPLLQRVELQQLAEQARAFRDIASDVTKNAEKKESQHGGDALETSGETVKDSDFQG